MNVVQKLFSAFGYRWKSGSNELRKIHRRLYKDQHQLTSTTQSDRYPELFAEVQRALNRRPQRVLSFGCSTGEECEAIGQWLKPERIVGADINSSNLKAAKKRVKLPNVTFIRSTDLEIAKLGPYQVIFCLSVLCRWEDTKDLEDCSAIYPFSKFNMTATNLDEQLAPGGLFVIYNSNFRFEDTDAFKTNSFEIIPSPSVVDSGFVHKFDSMNKRLHQPHSACLYRKGGSPSV